MSLLFYY